LQRYPGKVTRQALHHHKEASLWRLQVYQEYPAGTMRIMHGRAVPLDCRRFPEDGAGRGCLCAAAVRWLGARPPLRPRRGPVPLCPPLIPHDCPRPVWHGGRSRLLTRGALTALCCSPRQGCRPLGACCEAHCPRRAVAPASSMHASPAPRRRHTAARRWAWDGPALTASMRMREADG
jgi:hypothetical protein